jgi:hypothetical protein
LSRLRDNSWQDVPSQAGNNRHKNGRNNGEDSPRARHGGTLSCVALRSLSGFGINLKGKCRYNLMSYLFITLEIEYSGVLNRSNFLEHQTC